MDIHTEASPTIAAVAVSCDALLFPLIRAVRRRAQLKQAHLRMENQLGALERIISGDMGAKKPKAKEKYIVSPSTRAASEMNEPLLAALSKALHKEIRHVEKEIQALAKELPVWSWVVDQRGCGPLMLGLLVGEIGNLSEYAGPSRVWKRMGLAVMPDGKRQRRVTGEEAIAHGYCPRRRSVAWNLGQCLIKQNKGEYRRLYEERKAHELARLGTAKCVKAHANNRASRYIQKRFLRDLWLEWNGLASSDTHMTNATTSAMQYSSAAAEGKPAPRN